MVVTIRKYSPKDRQQLVQFMERLLDYLVSIDPLYRLRRLSEYGKSYTHRLLSKIKVEYGVILFAEDGGAVIGIIAGVIEKQKKSSLLECIPTRTGRIQELFVDEHYRSKGVGKLLMSQLEEYFRKMRCTIVKVEIFAPNNDAHLFYQHCGFQDRTIDMIQPLH